MAGFVVLCFLLDMIIGNFFWFVDGVFLFVFIKNFIIFGCFIRSFICFCGSVFSAVLTSFNHLVLMALEKVNWRESGMQRSFSW